jgi:hypothetical protein
VAVGGRAHLLFSLALNNATVSPCRLVPEPAPEPEKDAASPDDDVDAAAPIEATTTEEATSGATLADGGGAGKGLLSKIELI